MVSTSVRVPEIDANVARSWTLPASVYSDAAVLEREKKDIFWRTWQIVGRREQVAEAGDYFTTDLLGEPLLFVRDQTGRLRGFYNVCRHRAGPPASGCGNRKAFRCGYHGWTYNLEGKLLNAPEMEGTEDFRFDDFGLRPVHTEEWGPWVFVNLDDDCDALPAALGELREQTEKFHLERLHFYKRHEYHMECNWKVYIDNYLEGYHLPSVHPGLNRELDHSQYSTELFARHSRQSSPIRGPENETTVERRYKQAEGDLAAEYYWVYPNWMLNCYPDNTSLNIVLPVAAEKCVAIFEFYFSEEMLQTDAPESTFRFSHQIQLEDGGICEIVHRNLKSKSYERGRFSVQQEKGVHHFHRLYSRPVAG